MAKRLLVPAALAALLGLAALLRFTGLSFGLRHHPHWDERAFVEAVQQMRERSDLDHRFYEYPGLFVYVLHGALAFVPRDDLGGAQAYLVARGVVAGFGVLSVGLVFLLGRRLGGTAAGLGAALFLAVSPVDVAVAHMVRPDVVLQAGVLLTLLAFTRLGERPSGDAWAGAALGAATAVKFTGVLLAPSFLLARLAQPASPRVALRRTALAAAFAALVLALSTPYAFLHARQFWAGVTVQWTAHYAASGQAPRGYGQNAAFYVELAARALGPVGSVLFVAGLVLARRQWRAYGPAVLHLALTGAVFCTADRAYDRFLVPATGALALVAGRALAGAVRWGRGPALALGLVAAAFPWVGSWSYVREASRPGTRDLLADWVSSHVPPGALVLSSVENLRLDSSRFEVIPAWPLRPEHRRQALDVDYVLWTAEDDARILEGFETVTTIEGDGALSLPLRVSRPRQDLRLRYVQAPLSGALLRASENPTLVELLRDGRRDTAWTTRGPQRAGDFIELLLPAPIQLARIELDPGPRATGAGRRFQVFVSDDGERYAPAAVLQGRAEVWDQPGSKPATQVLLLNPPVRARAVRITQAGTGIRKWSVAEIALAATGHAPDGPSPPREAR